VAELNRNAAVRLRKKANLTVQAGTIEKTDAPERLRVEVEKTMRAFDIGQRTGLFRVPELVEYDELRGVAAFEKLAHLVSIRQELTFGSDHQSVTERTARALAAVHDLLELPEEMTLSLPDELREEGNAVFLHGDFSFNNVFLDARSGELVILDWQMTKIHGGAATYGTRYFDVVWFINNLFNRYLHHCLFSNNAVEMARCFLQAYGAAAGPEFDMVQYQDYVARFLVVTNRRRRQWPVSQRVLFAAFNHFWKRHLSSLSN